MLVAFVVGVGVGWTARAREPSAGTHGHTHTAYTYVPPPVPLPTVAPTGSAAASHTPWTEDAEAFAWPASPPAADVVAVDATHFVVRAAYLRHLIDDQAAVTKHLRLVPEQDHGVTVGIRVFGVLTTSPFGELGLQNGDLLETLNGLSLTRPDDALEAYTRVKTADKVVLRLGRRSANLDLHYRVAK